MLKFRLYSASILLIAASCIQAEVIKFDQYIKAGQSPQQAYTELIHSSPLVIIKFFKNGCAPCQQSADLFLKFSLKYPQITCVEINVATYYNLFTPFGLAGVPAFIYYKNGIKQAAHTGFNNLESTARMYFNL
jgi:thiol-disulfide isomerase/thioredoxin